VIQRCLGPYSREIDASSTLMFASVIAVGVAPGRSEGGLVVGVSVGTP